MKWIEKNFYIPETKEDPILKGHLKLETYQADALREALSKDEQGLYKYSIILWSDIKKSIKSTIAAAVNLYGTEMGEFGERYIIANDLKQADSRVAHYIRRAILLNPKFVNKYKTRGYRVTSPNGSYMEAIPIDPSGEAGSNADMLTFCLDQETQVLTRQGWKGWETLSNNDLVATRNKAGEFEWQLPRNVYCAPYSGKMIRISHRSLSALVTPNHRIYGKFIGGRGIAPGVNGNWRSEFVEKLDNVFLEADVARKTTGYFPVVDSTWVGGKADWFVIPGTHTQPERNISPSDYAEFMGWYLSEGCTIKKRGNIEGFCIGQSSSVNPEKRKNIISLLNRMGFVPHEWAGGMNIAVYHSVFGKSLSEYGLSDEKFVPENIKNLPVEYLSIFLKTFIQGDGCTNKFGGVIISTRSLQMRDDFTEIAQKCGYSISSYENADKRWKNNPVMYSVYLRAKTSTKTTRIEKYHWSEEEYSGMVFCPSTANGVIYVRRNGTYYWTGNSELWGAHQEAQRTMWAEMTLSPTKFGKSFRWIETYAGTVGQSDLLYELYQTGVQQGHLLWPDRLYPVTEGEPAPLELYVNETARMLCLWNTKPRCPWQTKAYYSSEQAVLLPNQFARMHRNQWTSGSDSFVPMEWWDSCNRISEPWPELPKNHAMVISLDAGVSSDNFGLVMGCRHPKFPDEVMMQYAQRWVPPTGGKIDFVGNADNPGPEMVVEKLIDQYNVVEVAYDPYQLHDMAERQKKKNRTWWRAFGQGNERLESDNQLRTLIRDKRVWHRGEPVVREHMENSDGQVDDEERKVRIVKRAEKLKIDLTVCQSMNYHELLRLNL